jgi:exonuclease SbcD
VDVEPEDLLRVVVTEPARAGLPEEVRELLPGALEVHVERSEPAPARTPERARTDRAPAELLHDYLASRDVHDPRVEALFARLHDEVLAGDG